MSIKKDLLKKTKEYAEYAKEHAKDYADQAKEYVKDQAKDFASSAKEHGKDYAETAKGKAKDYADDAGDYAKMYGKAAKGKAKDYADESEDYAKIYGKAAKGKAKGYAKYAQDYAKDEACGPSAASVAVALIGGLVIGAALGILFAPEAGTETRSNLGNQLQDLGTTVADKAQQGKEAITNLKDKAVDAVKSKINGEENDGDIDHPSFS